MSALAAKPEVPSPAPRSSPYRHLLFVYGTLKRGENNYAGWLADPCHAVFIGTARTRYRYPFFVNLAPGFPGCSPAVLDMPVSESQWAAAAAAGEWQARAEHVEGELFLVTEAMRRWLDVLEGTADGTYAARLVEVEHVQPPSSLRRRVTVASPGSPIASAASGAPQRTLFEHLTAPFCLAEGPGHRLRAALYFREKDYPEDWASAAPSTSTELLASFTAENVLAAYGARFAGGVPAHLRGPSAARALQRALDALPEALQPPTSYQRQKRLLAEALRRQREFARADGADETTAAADGCCSNYYNAAVDGALTGAGVLTAADSDGSGTFGVGTPLLPKPLVLFIIDGIGDNTYVELGNRTPLEVVAGVPSRKDSAPQRTLPLDRFIPPEWRDDTDAAAPFAALATTDPATNRYMRGDGINTITAAGVSGMMDPYLAGRSCGSDTAHLSFFGYDPELYYRGRGAYETLGTAVDSSESDADDDGDEGGKRANPTAAGAGAGDAAVPSSADDGADAWITVEKDVESSRGFVLDDEDVCFKSNFATFADPEEDGFGDEDAALERRSAPLSGLHSEAAKAEAGGLPFNTSEAFFITHRRCDRNFTKEGPLLCRYLNGMRIDKDVRGVPFDYPHVLKIKYATEHRCGVALSGAKTVLVEASRKKGGADDASTGPAAQRGHSAETEAGGRKEVVIGMLSDKITGTDCLKDGLPLRKCVPTVSEAADPVEYARAVYTCRLVEAASAKITKYLKRHAINEARRQHNHRLSRGEAGAGGASSSATQRQNVANIILLRGAAKKGWVPTFANRHGLNGAMVAPTCIIRGLSVCCGLECKTVCPVCFPHRVRKLRAALAERLRALTSSAAEGSEVRHWARHLHALRRVNATDRALAGATGDYHSDLRVKVAAALHCLRLRCPWPSFHNSDRVAAVAAAQQRLQGTDALPHVASHPHLNFVVVHVKGVDDAGHDGHLHHKMRLIGECGEALREIFAALPDGAALAVIADHSTPLFVGDHCCEPVPVSVAVKRGHGSTEPCGEGATAAVGVPSASMAEDVAAFRAAWQQQQQQCDAVPHAESGGGEEAEEAGVLFQGMHFANTAELCFFLLEEKARTVPRDGARWYGEGEVALRGGLGRFRGDELMGIMKRTQYYYHYV